MKSLVLVMVVSLVFAVVALEAPEELPVEPGRIEEILDFESIDRENEQELRKRLHKRDPRKDEAAGRVLLARRPVEDADDGRQV